MLTQPAPENETGREQMARKRTPSTKPTSAEDASNIAVNLEPQFQKQAERLQVELDWLKEVTVRLGNDGSESGPGESKRCR